MLRAYSVSEGHDSKIRTEFASRRRRSEAADSSFESQNYPSRRSSPSTSRLCLQDNGEPMIPLGYNMSITWHARAPRHSYTHDMYLPLYAFSIEGMLTSSELLSHFTISPRVAFGAPFMSGGSVLSTSLV